MSSVPPSLPSNHPNAPSCSLLGSTGLLVQSLMAIFVLASLLIKRTRENPQRAWPVWAADVAKQIIGQAFLHSSNLLISTLFSHHRNRDACTAYFLSIFVDCTLGVLVIFATLRLFSWILVTRLHLPGFRTGQYYNYRIDDNGNPVGDGHFGSNTNDNTTTSSSNNKLNNDESLSSPVMDEDNLDHSHSQEQTYKSPTFQILWWARQLFVYLLTLCIMKATIIGFFWIPAVFTAGDWLLSWLGEATKVVFVLMLFPLAMNAFQVSRIT